MFCGSLADGVERTALSTTAPLSRAIIRRETEACQSRTRVQVFLHCYCPCAALSDVVTSRERITRHNACNWTARCPRGSASHGARTGRTRASARGLWWRAGSHEQPGQGERHGMSQRQGGRVPSLRRSARAAKSWLSYRRTPGGSHLKGGESPEWTRNQAAARACGAKASVCRAIPRATRNRESQRNGTSRKALTRASRWYITY